MSIWPRSFVSDPTSSSSRLFRFLDEYGDYEFNRRPQYRTSAVMRTFEPKFDVKELPDSYELQGELPGVEKKDIEIELSDQATLTVRGKTEHSYTAGTPPAGFVEGPISRGAIEGDKATARDKPKAQITKGKDGPETQVTKEQDESREDSKYWVSERSIGEFSRSFNFPQSIDQDQVQASLKSGILNIVVPKAKKQDKRKINIT
ncbi:hypothetical protein V491_03012 [Pseudogymnoascus sp. VKM F-3775]|nr:hypothetical protein V491_03012 [Pseudogymnoascus sp. VKM F-3775]